MPSRCTGRKIYSAALACGALLAVLPAISRSDDAAGPSIVEEVLEVEATATSLPDTPVMRRIQVTVTRPSTPGIHPFLLIAHGRGSTPEERARVGRANYPANAAYFAKRGFVVLVPTRIGYGVTGGPDLEFTGPCGNKAFEQGVAPAVRELQAVLRQAATRGYIDRDRGVLLGESFGALVVLALAASGDSHAVGVINFSGGDGGDVHSHPDNPCRPDQLAEAFARWGRAVRIPSLWLYSENDRYWGSHYPPLWFAAYTGGGAVARYVALPADKNNGHYVFNRNPPLWRPAVESFLVSIGLSSPGLT